MYPHLFFCLLIVIGCSCSQPENSAEEIIAENNIIDSFALNGIAARCELQSLHYLNDSSILSFNQESNEVSLYTLKNESKTFVLSQRKSIAPQGYIPAFFKLQDNSFCSISTENKLYKYDKDWKVSDTTNLNLNFPHLKHSYLIGCWKSMPVLQSGDTLISTFAYGGLNDYLTYFKEPAITEYIPEDTNARQISSYLPKPASLKHFMLPFPRYCYAGNTIYLIYPCFDSLYIYNRYSKSAHTVALKNKNYQLPLPFDYVKGLDFSYLTQYELHNFCYKAIYHNPLSGNFLLFYVSPATTTIAGANPTFDDQPLKAIVINKDYQVLQYWKFKFNYSDITNQLYIPGKGLSLARHGQDDFKKTHFYLFNF